MNSEEIYKEIRMCYNDLCDYLISKYGAATCDYFSTAECISRNPKVGRGKEGLECHHRDEDKGGSLSGPVSASRQPFEWQKADRLVYCNLIEHLILHIKIGVMRQKDYFFKPSDFNSFFSTGGIYQICYSINSLFYNQGGKSYYRIKMYELIKDNLQDYINIIKLILNYIDSQYYGERKPITGINVEDTYLESGESHEEMMKKLALWSSLTSSDWFEIIKDFFATTYEGKTCDFIKEKVFIDHTNQFVESLSKALLFFSKSAFASSFAFSMALRVFLTSLDVLSI